MARSLKEPAFSEPAVRRMELSKFKGVDLSSSVTAVKAYRAVSAMNMMPDIDGFPVKRPGYRQEAQYPGAVYGAHRFHSTQKTVELIHAGDTLYEGEEALYTGMALGQSRSYQVEGKLWIADGKRLLCYDGEKAVPVDQLAQPPMITIGRAPNGDDAKSYLPGNLLTPWVTDSFLGTQGDKEYQLSFTGLGAGKVTVSQLSAAGQWEEKQEGSGFTVDRAAGKVIFSAAPGLTPVTGEDNLRITYEKGESGADTINRCRFGILYGVNGALDRLWLSGNPDHPAWDWYSAYKDPTYFSDQWYSIVGQDASPIVGYSVLSDKLAAFKRGEENDRNVFLRGSALDEEGNALFPFVNVLQGESAIGPVGSLGGEPLFLTGRGVYALTPADITGERYSQQRSYYLAGGLTREKGLEDALSVGFGRFFAVGVNGRLYLLDGEQKSYEASQPHSTYQYEGYVWDNIPATARWERDGRLCFGTQAGQVMAFYDAGEPGGYQDNGAPIRAHWTTPLMELSTWARYKTVTGVWVVGQPYNRSGGEIYYATDREYEKLVKEFHIDIFNFNDVDFQRFTFNTLDRPTVVPTRRKEKKVKLFQVKVSNQRAEPFGIIAVTLEYREGGKIKK